MQKIIVIGGLNIDFLGVGVNRIVGKGELGYGGEFDIKPGGKSRNIAQMISNQMNTGEVTMIGKTAKDKYGLYKIPLDSLKQSGVDTENIIINESGKYKPGVALIPVDKNGNNQIYVLPGINNSFSASDLEQKQDIFEKIGKNNGLLVLSLELPLETAIYGIKLANKYGLKVILDSGGMIQGVNYSQLLNQKIFLIKPNEQETEILTGIKVTDFETARIASKKFLKYGIENVLITVGEKGAYYFSNNKEKHYKVPDININKTQKDETGCGDQTIATISSYLAKGEHLDYSIKKGILSGTLQFYRTGATPLNKKDLEVN
ncbi:MAG: PfkB family carbohydrate kinase [Candidatus Gracilibacteria bacterium]|nr:PfkB family carbohydrate kinase [Candidatus Gracilibacteria bacterium]